MRMLLNIIRTIPSLIWAVIAVAAMGANALAGVAALTLYSTGYLGKFFSEAFESVDMKVARSLRGIGADPLQVIPIRHLAPCQAAHLESLYLDARIQHTLSQHHRICRCRWPWTATARLPRIPPMGSLRYRALLHFNSRYRARLPQRTHTPTYRAARWL